MRPKISALIFDIGNVLLPHDYARAKQRLRSEQNKETVPDAEKLIAATCIEYESGRINRAEFLSIVKNIYAYRDSDESFIKIWCEIFEENIPLHLQIPKLAATCPLYLLSNIGCIHREFIHNRYPVFTHFTAGIYSYEVGFMKPHRRIYEIAIERFNLIPEDTLFIDDLSANVEGARAAGFQAFTYDWRRHSLFEEALSSYQLVPPSEPPKNRFASQK